MRLAVFCRAGLTSFIGDLLRHWEEKHEVTYYEATGSPQDALKIFASMGWADVAFFDWGDALAMAGTHMAARCSMVVRVNGYEVFGDLSGGAWDRVHTIVFSAEHKEALFRSQVQGNLNTKIVRYGVNTDKFQIPEGKEYNKQIVHAGLMNYRKGYDFALLALYDLLQKDSDWALTFIRTIQDQRYQWAMYEIAESLGVSDRVTWKGRVPDLAAEYHAHSVVLSTSIEESFHYTLAEGMASGLLPLCRDWTDADRLYPPGAICRTPAEMAQKCLDWWKRCKDKREFSGVMRGWIRDRFSLERQFSEMDAILEQAAEDGRKARAKALGSIASEEQGTKGFEPFFNLLEAKPGDTVLEFGCGAGWFLRAALERGLKPVGIEENTEAQARAQENAPGALILEGMESFIEPGSVPRIVTSRLGDDPERTLAWIRERLAPDGVALISVANAGFPGEPLPGDIYERMDSRVGWGELFMGAGFGIAGIEPYHGPFNALPPESAYRYIFKLCKAPMGTFTFEGREYAYFNHPYNRTWRNDRAVEVPIIWGMVREETGYVLEVGNVLGHYFEVHHAVLDKYEKAEGVTNADAETFQGKGFDLIVSISTLEHVGRDEEPKDPEKPVRVVENLKRCLRRGGRLVFTFPLGYHPALDVAFEEGRLGLTEAFFMKRLTADNQWRQATWEGVKGSKFGEPFNNGNGMVIGVYHAKEERHASIEGP